MAAKLSSVQKAAIAETAQNFKRRSQVAVSAAKEETAKVKAKLREEHRATKGEALMVGAGSIAAGAVASQVYRELGVKRDKMGMAMGINYGGAVVGMLMSYYAKPNQTGMRVAGGALVGLASAQIALDLQAKDLVPGFND